LSDNPSLLSQIKEGCLLVLCTSGDVEGGVPQLIKNKHLLLEETDNKKQVATFVTGGGKRLRLLLGCDGVGQAPNMTMEDGSGSVANLMSDMEFYALGALLGSSTHGMLTSEVNQSPLWIQQLVATEWLDCFFSSSLGDKQSNIVPDENASSADTQQTMEPEGGQHAVGTERQGAWLKNCQRIDFHPTQLNCRDMTICYELNAK